MGTLVLRTGAFLLCLGAVFASPFQIGDIFVSGTGGNVYRFNASGTLLQTLPGSNGFGLAFDPSGNLYVAGGPSVVRYDSSGNPLGTFVSGFPGMFGNSNDIGFNSAGEAYVAGIQDTNFDFLSKYSASGALLTSTSVLQGQENFVYVDASGSQVLMTPGTTSLVDPFNPSTLAPGPSLFIPNGGPNGDIQSLPGGGFLVVSNMGIEQFDASNTLVFNYNPILSGTFIGISAVSGSTFWAVSDFGEVREFSLGSGTPIASFNAPADARGIAVFEGAVPEPSSLTLFAGGLGLVFLAARRRRNRRLSTAG